MSSKNNKQQKDEKQEERNKEAKNEVCRLLEVDIPDDTLVMKNRHKLLPLNSEMNGGGERAWPGTDRTQLLPV